MKLFTPLFYCLFSLGLVLCCFSQSQAQGRIKGIVHELATAQPLPFATVSVYSPQDSLVGGGITDEKGRYEIELPLGTYYALVEFMGFESITSDPFTLTRDKATLE
ncbi:MAG: carboxypeptidase-like regulatory domain-containing protein, partial [Bacteroidota bacterium]